MALRVTQRLFFGVLLQLVMFFAVVFCSSIAMAQGARKTVVLALDKASDAAWPLAQQVYGEPALRPDNLDEQKARVLAGEEPTDQSPQALKDLAQMRKAVVGDDAASKRLLIVIAAENAASHVLVVYPGQGGNPATARVFSVTNNRFEPVVLSATVSTAQGGTNQPTAANTIDWSFAVQTLKAGALSAPAPSASSTGAAGATKSDQPPPKPKSAFYSSPWFWGALGLAAVGGAIFYFASKDTSSTAQTIEVKGRVVRLVFAYSLGVRELQSRVVRAAASAFDWAAVAAFTMGARSKSSREEGLSFEDKMAMLEKISESYNDPEYLTEPDRYFPLAKEIDPNLTRIRPWSTGGSVLDASWPSPLHPILDRMTEKYTGFASNQIAHCRFFLGSKPRPAVILIHGYMGGQYRFEELVWPIEWLDKMGLDVALFVLPFHAKRRSENRKGPPVIPSADPRMNNEAFRHAIFDLRTLIGFLRSQGAPSVGVMGMSLGGYTTALLATIEKELSFAVPIIPLSSLADYARDQGRLGPSQQATQLYHAIEKANQVVSPYSRAPKIDSSRVLVLGAEADKITPIHQAVRVAAHLRAPLIKLQGGHLLQVGMKQGWREVKTLLKRLEIVLEKTAHG